MGGLSISLDFYFRTFNPTRIVVRVDASMIIAIVEIPYSAVRSTSLSIRGHFLSRPRARFSSWHSFAFASIRTQPRVKISFSSWWLTHFRLPLPKFVFLNTSFSLKTKKRIFGSCSWCQRRQLKWISLCSYRWINFGPNFELIIDYKSNSHRDCFLSAQSLVQRSS